LLKKRFLVHASLPQYQCELAAILARSNIDNRVPVVNHFKLHPLGTSKQPNGCNTFPFAALINVGSIAAYLSSDAVAHLCRHHPQRLTGSPDTERSGKSGLAPLGKASRQFMNFHIADGIGKYYLFIYHVNAVPSSEGRSKRAQAGGIRIFLWGAGIGKAMLRPIPTGVESCGNLWITSDYRKLIVFVVKIVIGNLRHGHHREKVSGPADGSAQKICVKTCVSPVSQADCQTAGCYIVLRKS